MDEKATQLHAIASLKALLDAAKTEADTTVTNNSRSKPVSPPQVPPSVQPTDAPLTTVDIEDQANGDAPTVQVRSRLIYLTLLLVYVQKHCLYPLLNHTKRSSCLIINCNAPH